MGVQKKLQAATEREHELLELCQSMKEQADVLRFLLVCVLSASTPDGHYALDAFTIETVGKKRWGITAQPLGDGHVVVSIDESEEDAFQAEEEASDGGA